MSDHEYLFDATVTTSVRIRAHNQKEARAKLAGLLDCASANFGALDGQPVVAEASLEGRAALVEVDGEPYADKPPLLDALVGELRNCIGLITRFDRTCRAADYTDTGDAWTLLRGMRTRMKALLKQADGGAA